MLSLDINWLLRWEKLDINWAIWQWNRIGGLSPLAKSTFTSTIGVSNIQWVFKGNAHTFHQISYTKRPRCAVCVHRDQGSVREHQTCFFHCFQCLLRSSMNKLLVVRTINESQACFIWIPAGRWYAFMSAYFIQTPGCSGLTTHSSVLNTCLGVPPHPSQQHRE